MEDDLKIVGATHDFHDEAYASAWANRYKLTKTRFDCFAFMGDLLAPYIEEESLILELGVGPGYLAHYLLTRFPNMHYLGLDFSRPMLTIATQQLRAFKDRVRFQRIDLTNESWHREIDAKFAAIVSTWTLHDLGAREATAEVYRAAHDLLFQGGLFINSDFFKPDGATKPFEPGRYEIAAHLEDLTAAGFLGAACKREFEVERQTPATHQNYATLTGTR